VYTYKVLIIKLKLLKHKYKKKNYVKQLISLRINKLNNKNINISLVKKNIGSHNKQHTTNTVASINTKL
jgi:hypothetical protein